MDWKSALIRVEKGERFLGERGKYLITILNGRKKGGILGSLAHDL